MTPGRQAPGFTLVEVTISLGIVAFVLVSIVGLLAVGMRLNRSSEEEIAAANAATRLLAEYRARPSGSMLGGAVEVLPGLTNTNSSAVTNQITAFQIDDAAKAVAVGRFRVQGQAVIPSVPSDPATVYLDLSWPPAATNNPSGHFQIVTAISRQ